MAESPQPSSMSEVPRVRVVIAEDEAIIRLDLKETLTDEGYEVVGDTGRGDHAVELVAELDPDVVILDPVQLIPSQVLSMTVTPFLACIQQRFGVLLTMLV